MKTMLIICSMLIMTSFMANLAMSAHVVDKRMVYRAVETTEDVVEEGPLVSNDISEEITEITEIEEVYEEPLATNDLSYEVTEIIEIEDVPEKPPTDEKPSEESSWWWWPF